MGTFPTTSRSVSRDSPIPFLAKGACAPFGPLLARLSSVIEVGRDTRRSTRPGALRGLLRVRGRLMAALVPTEGGGRAVSWTDHPRGWGATPPDLPPPYVLRQMIQVSAGHASEGNTLGPIIETDERLGPRWTAREARQIFLLEFQEGWAKAMACSHRVKTSEYRDQHGEYGSPSWPVGTGDGLSLRTGRQMSGVKGRKTAGPRTNKPGTKPEHGFSLDARLRKIKSRCKKRGVPFILARYLKPKREPEHEHS